NVRLQVPEQQVSSKSTGGQFCSQLGRVAGVPLKVLFVLDMSMSNIGSFVQGTGTQFSFDTSKGTDVTGNRFQAIENFIRDCGSSDTQYAITGFSNGIVTTNGSELCNMEFTSNTTQVAATIQSYKDIQTRDLAFYRNYSGGGMPSDVKMRETAYLKGFECARKIFNEDLVRHPDQKSFYQTFFVTDGRPTQDGVCNTDPKCFVRELQSLMIQINGAQSTLRLQPIYYGPESEKDAALKILKPIAEAGRVTDVIVSDQLRADLLCGLTAKPVNVRYRKDLFFMINLTAKMVNQVLEPDSDIDGIVDREEATYGANPTDPRTAGVLDSICRDIGGLARCRTLLPTLRCKGVSNNLGLTDCDIQALKLDQVDPTSADKGIDSDGDGLPDLLELIRDTLPASSDGTSDLDGDGLTNQVELARGSQVNRPDSGAPAHLLLRSYEQRIPEAPGCPTSEEAWELNVDNVPLIPVAEYKDLRTCEANQSPLKSCLSFSHAANENLILLAFTSRPENDPTAPAQIWGMILKAPLSYGFGALKRIQPSDFVLLGEVRNR
ncbi:MAG: hypothetical protein K2X47_10595, partial [Bdellovibrionales bacterium]|nr:hypothetical protein [Bdellovibrionales bacterium]